MRFAGKGTCVSETTDIVGSAPDVVRRTVAGETILVPIKGKLADLQRVYVLNEVADFVWERLDGKHTVDAICAEACDTYDVPTDEVTEDVVTFLGELTGHGLVEEVATP